MLLGYTRLLQPPPPCVQVEGVSEVVRTAFSLFLEIYELDCQLSGDDEKLLYVDLLRRIAELPWESKAKYSPLGALLPYVGTDKVNLVLWGGRQ